MHTRSRWMADLLNQRLESGRVDHSHTMQKWLALHRNASTHYKELNDLPHVVLTFDQDWNPITHNHEYHTTWPEDTF